jgi:serine protease inhibitor
MLKRFIFKELNFLLLLFIGIIFLQCSKKPVAPKEEVPDLAAVEKTLVQSDNEFGLTIFKEIVREEKNKNVFISPLSVSMALGMTYNGANGETQEAMQKTLGLNGLSIEEVDQCYQHLIESLTSLDPKVKFQIANSIWYRLGLTPEEEFLNLCQKYFDAQVRGLDFNHPNAADTINGWVDQGTNGKIKEIINGPINPLTVMFLIDAIYFKGIWTYEFDKNKTRDDLFILPDGSEKSCKMMEQRGLYKYFENDTFQAIDLPYGDGDFSMTIFLPVYGTNVDSLIAEFDQEKLNYWMSCFSGDSMDIYIPKFKLEYELKLNDVLTTLGMGIAFTPYQADFTKMYKGVDVFIDEVKHKTFVEVNEEGTEAAAVTSVVIVVSSEGSSMRVNRPFVFMIRENKSQTILFIGKIVEPNFELE